MQRPAQTSQHSVNGTARTAQYSDSEEDIVREEDKESGKGANSFSTLCRQM